MNKTLTVLFAVLVFASVAAAEDEVTTMPIDPDDPEEIDQQPDTDKPKGITDLPGSASDTAKQVTATITDALGSGGDTIQGIGETISGLLTGDEPEDETEIQ